MEQLCKTQFPQNLQCPNAAKMYEMGTTMFGVKGFGELQNDYCTCVERKEIVSHYGNLFQDIYKTHSNKTQEEIDSTIDNLLIKAGEDASVRKLGTLFYQIMKKYDTAIRHEDRRIGMDPPKPKRDHEL